MTPRAGRSRHRQTADRGAGSGDHDPDRAAEADDEPAGDELLELRRRPARALSHEESAEQQQDRAHPEAEDVAAGHDRRGCQDTDGEPGRLGFGGPLSRRPEAVRPEADHRRGRRGDRLDRPAQPRSARRFIEVADRDGDESAGEECRGEPRGDRERTGQRIGDEGRRQERDQESEQRRPGLAGRDRDNRPRHDDAGQAREREVHGAGDGTGD